MFKELTIQEQESRCRHQTICLLGLLIQLFDISREQKVGTQLSSIKMIKGGKVEVVFYSAGVIYFPSK